MSTEIETGPDDPAVAGAVKREPDLQAIKRNFIVMTEPDGKVTRVIEKPRHPRTDLKGCGIYLFDPAFFDAVRRTPRTAMRNEYEITDSIQIFIDDGYRVVGINLYDDDARRLVWSAIGGSLTHYNGSAQVFAYADELVST